MDGTSLYIFFLFYSLFYLQVMRVESVLLTSKFFKRFFKTFTLKEYTTYNF